MFGCHKLLSRLLRRGNQDHRGVHLRGFQGVECFQSERRKQIIRSRILAGIQAKLAQDN